MGYRYYFYAVPKTLVAEIKKCTTNDEYISLCRKAGLAVDEYEDGPFCAPYNLGKETYEFGKEIDFEDDIYNDKNIPLFSDKLEEIYSDYGAMICTKDAFVAAIESYRKKIIDYLKGLLQEKSPSPYDLRPKQERQEWDITEKLAEWENKWYDPFDSDLDSPRIVRSWLFEYAIFELVRCYKTFDWENNELIFLGW